jgi:hypothetical protein
LAAEPGPTLQVKEPRALGALLRVRRDIDRVFEALGAAGEEAEGGAVGGFGVVLRDGQRELRDEDLA